MTFFIIDNADAKDSNAQFEKIFFCFYNKQRPKHFISAVLKNVSHLDKFHFYGAAKFQDKGFWTVLINALGNKHLFSEKTIQTTKKENIFC